MSASPVFDFPGFSAGKALGAFLPNDAEGPGYSFNRVGGEIWANLQTTTSGTELISYKSHPT